MRATKAQGLWGGLKSVNDKRVPRKHCRVKQKSNPGTGIKWETDQGRELFENRMGKMDKP